MMPLPLGGGIGHIMISESSAGIKISLYVIPNAPRSQIVGEYNSQLKIKIKAPPVDGKANQAIIEFFSELFEIPQKDLEILKGDKSKSKTLLVRGLSASEILQFIKP